MKDRLIAYFRRALEHPGLGLSAPQEGIHFTRPKNPEHGDWSTNIALRLSAQQNEGSPRQWAERILASLPQMPEVRECRLAGPGFINLYIHEDRLNQVIADIQARAELFGCVEPAPDAPATLVEYLSVNPTGPLHIGHGRVAVYGSALVSIMSATGHRIDSEYYINDAGRQIDVLVLSVLVRAAQRLCELSSELTYLRAHFDRIAGLHIYQGQYLLPVATALVRDRLPGNDWLVDLAGRLRAGEEGAEDTDAEAALDRALVALKEALGDRFEDLRDFVLGNMLGDIREDLDESGVSFDNWFSERSLKPLLAGSVRRWREHPDVYTRDDALWFASTRHGDDKDRVLVRKDGTPTYFAMDLLYHGNKISRGYHRFINILGADHHGYVPRLRAAVGTFCNPPRPIESALVQFVRLYDGGEVVSMSTRSGQFVSLRSLRERIGQDALRFYFLLSDVDQGLDFDLSLVVQRNNENPLYYVQYACVRCRQVLDKASARQRALCVASGLAHLSLLRRDSERELVAQLERYPEAIGRASDRLEPAILVRYTRDLAAAFHANYGDQPYIVEETGLRNARLLMVSATLQVLSNALGLLAISVPDKM